MSRDIAIKKEVVLVVDDDPVLKDLAKDILELFGHTVLVPGTRGDAFNLCDRWGRAITLVVLDASMSTSFAAEIIFEKISGINPEVKVIVTSNNRNDERNPHLFKSGRTAFLKKPYRMTELVRMVEQLQEAG